MAEKRYTVIFDAKDNASARLSAMEQQAKKTSRGLDDLASKTETVSSVTERLNGSYRDANGKFLSVSDAVKKTNTEMDRSRGFLSRMGSGFTRIGSEGRGAISRLTTGLSGVIGILGGVVTAAGLASVAVTGLAAKGVWDHIIQPAMDVESNKLQIEALSGSPEKGSQIYEMSKDFGKNSIYANEDIMNGTFAFMQNTKDTDQLKEMLAITERLAALNKDEGFRGASFSLKEAMSGDITSIAERFNVGKKTLRENGFDSAADWQTNLGAVDKSLGSIGIDDNYVKKVAESTPAQWAKIQKNTKSSAAAIGMGMLEELRPAMKKINGLFDDTTGLTRFTNAMSNKFRQSLQDVFGFGDGISLTWDDITRWSEDTFDGVASVMTATGDTFMTLVTILAGGDLSKPQETFENFGETLKGIADKVETIRQGFIELDQWGDKIGKFTGIGQGGGMQKQIDDGMWYLPEGAKGGRGLIPWALQGFPSERQKPDGSHALGLSYVPKDNYRANLHEGERVLTKQQNNAYMANASGGSGVVITGNTFNVRQESDIDAIGEAILMRLQVRG